MKLPPKGMTICSLEVLVMPNGEILCLGQSLGYVSKLGAKLKEVAPPKRGTV
jgi:hypothetical protein